VKRGYANRAVGIGAVDDVSKMNTVKKKVKRIESTTTLSDDERNAYTMEDVLLILAKYFFILALPCAHYI
jgi:hypothetical protein